MQDIKNLYQEHVQVFEEVEKILFSSSNNNIEVIDGWIEQCNLSLNTINQVSK